jgi:hypothetical protein
MSTPGFSAELSLSNTVEWYKAEARQRDQAGTQTRVLPQQWGGCHRIYDPFWGWIIVCGRHALE